ncbi:MAG TPA: NADH-quinone oxidoreductase subunit N [Verrucomicrobiae bacterium]|nr:NADH-quinone oxidoreductase subunit N [Verrucomicrobiae bacterium]
MTPIPYLEVFKALGAEAVLVVTAFAALTIDLASLRRAEMSARRRTLGTVSAIGLLASVIPLWAQLGQPHHVFLGGTLAVDDLILFFKLVIVVLSVVTVLISMNYDVGRHVGEYFAVLLFGAIGMMLLISAEELITIFVALELTSISLYILTAFHKGELRSQEAAVKYFMFGAISSAFLLFGLSYVFGPTGTTSLEGIHEFIAQTAGQGMGALLAAGLLFILVGFGFKVAIAPFHLWAPDAYEGAPTPVTAFIATGSKVASFFVLLKLLFVAFAGMQGSAFWGHFSSGWVMLVAISGALSMVLGNCAAIVQHNIKRLLAYSAIAHAGYIFIGLAAATQMGATSVLFYILVYSLTNVGAFGVVAALSSRAGGDEMENFNGMARRAPFLSLLMLIFVLSLAGIPPLGGFFGKFFLFASAVQRDPQNFGLLWLVILGIVMSAVSLYYYLILLKHIYVAKGADESRVKTPAYLNFCLALVALTVVALGLFPDRMVALLNGLLAVL